ncbi:PilZ domain-containing protein [Vibrio sp. R78045]|uniref:PilZ domain-containing protein n=1 Tax=Vibrio sp. R78045 TaxID=3093868 RepID=UPI0036F29A29
MRQLDFKERRTHPRCQVLGRVLVSVKSRFRNTLILTGNIQDLSQSGLALYTEMSDIKLVIGQVYNIELIFAGEPVKALHRCARFSQNVDGADIVGFELLSPDSKFKAAQRFIMNVSSN